MEFLRWLVENFGLFFGGIFLTYLYLIVHRLTYLFDLLRRVDAGGHDSSRPITSLLPPGFLQPWFDRLEASATTGSGSADAVADAIWFELDGQVSVHFAALNGHINTLILFGFAGTIFGSIGAFNTMFQGMAQGMAAEAVFVGSWNNGLATALYTSLGAATIGGSLITLLCSRFLSSRAKRLESLVALRIAEIIESVKPMHKEHGPLVDSAPVSAPALWADRRSAHTDG